MKIIKLYLIILCLIPLFSFANSEADKKTLRALSLIDNGGSVEKGIETLQEAAYEGSNEAKYRLGWLYMQPKATIKADNDIALKYLEQVKGRYELSAYILTGVIYAQGSKNIPKNISMAEKIFNDASVALNNQFSDFQKKSESDRNYSVLNMDEGQIIIENYTILNGFSNKYGIKIKPIK